MSRSRLHRAYHPSLGTEGSVVRLSEEESRHVAKVVRLRPGDPVRVFDGRGLEVEATVESVARPEVEIRIGAAIPGFPDAPFPVTVFQALCRPERVDWMVQKSTEIGIAAIRMVQTRRVDAGRRAAGRTQRWSRIALEACKQCGRRCLPEISETDEIPAELPRDVLGWLLHRGEGSGTVAASLRQSRPGALWIAVGPEGGFHPDEAQRLLARDWAGVTLGPRTLRTETAGIVAAALALHAWGDLG